MAEPSVLLHSLQVINFPQDSESQVQALSYTTQEDEGCGCVCAGYPLPLLQR